MIIATSTYDANNKRPFAQYQLERIMADIQYYGTGRRKTSIARVYFRPGEGKITVKRREFENYFPNEALRMIINQPLRLTETTGKFDILVNVGGGGISGQAGAVRHGITRALLEF